MGCVVKATLWSIYLQEKGGWVGPRAGAEKFSPTGIRSPDRPACIQSPYRLRYPSPHFILSMFVILA